MLSAFLIALREGVEAALVVGIILLVMRYFRQRISLKESLPNMKASASCFATDRTPRGRKFRIDCSRSASCFELRLSKFKRPEGSSFFSRRIQFNFVCDRTGGAFGRR